MPGCTLGLRFASNLGERSSFRLQNAVWLSAIGIARSRLTHASGPERSVRFYTSAVPSIVTEPGELPDTMAAWVFRADRFGAPRDAFRLEEIEVPERAAMEVVVRVVAAGVNYNNVSAALGEPVSVCRHHAEAHHIGGSDASGMVLKVGEGVTRWKPGDEVVIHCNQASYEDPEVHGLDPMAAPFQKTWGHETTWGSFAQFCKVQAQQLLPKPPALTWEEAASYGLTYFTAYRMLMRQAQLRGGQRVLVWGCSRSSSAASPALKPSASCPRQDRDPRGRGGRGAGQDRGRPRRDPGRGGRVIRGIPTPARQ
jgi:alcohol dehydrogenase-like protein